LARKALLKRLTLQHMEKNNDVRDVSEHSLTINKSNEIEIDINRDLLSVMSLYSLSFSLKNFRYRVT